MISGPLAAVGAVDVIMGGLGSLVGGFLPRQAPPQICHGLLGLGRGEVNPVLKGLIGLVKPNATAKQHGVKEDGDKAVKSHGGTSLQRI